MNVPMWYHSIHKKENAPARVARAEGRKAGARRGGEGQRHVEQRRPHPTKFRSPPSARSQGVTNTH